MAYSAEPVISLGRSPRLGDAGRGGGLADVLQDRPHIYRFRDKGDDAHLGAAVGAGQGERIKEARRQHGPAVAGGGRPRAGGGSSAAASMAGLDTGSVATGAGARAVTAGRNGELGASTP